jgi:ABC-type uncharacterized transport system substrate-binding protein
MRRREFIAGIAGTAAWPLAARAQQSMPVIGVLYGVSAAPWAQNIAGFRRGLNEMGFVEGRSVAIEYRWAEGQFDLMPAMAADLVARRVAVILVQRFHETDHLLAIRKTGKQAFHGEKRMSDRSCRYDSNQGSAVLGRTSYLSDR